MSRKNTTAESIRLVVLGSGGAGKTTLIHQYMFGTFIEEYEPTKADTFRKAITIERRSVQFDILGNRSLMYDSDIVKIQLVKKTCEKMRNSFFKDGDGFLMVYAINNKESFDAVRKFHEEILHAKENAEFPCALVANKTDLDSKREVSKEDGQNLANELKCTFFEISAKQQGQVGNVFSTVAISIWKFKSEGINTKETKTRKCTIL